MSINNFRQSYYQLSNYPNSKIRYGARDKFIIWESNVQPIWYTKKYTLCLNYERLWPPRIWIVEPDFSKKNYLPHVYADQGNRLCLYHPKDWAWHSSCNIIDTIVRWSLAWIVYFEDYLRSGKWCGPEAVHKMKNDLKEARKEEVSGCAKKPKKENTPIYLKEHPIRYTALQKKRQKKS